LDFLALKNFGLAMLLRESTRFHNKDNEPKAQVIGYLSSQKNIQFFQKQALSKAFCHFPNAEMRRNVFREETNIVKSILAFSQCQNEKE